MKSWSGIGCAVVAVMAILAVCLKARACVPEAPLYVAGKAVPKSEQPATICNHDSTPTWYWQAESAGLAVDLSITFPEPIAVSFDVLTSAWQSLVWISPRLHSRFAP